MSRMLTLDDATGYQMACRIPNRGKRHLRIYLSTDAKGRSQWLARAGDVEYLSPDVILTGDGNGGHRWTKRFGDGSMEGFGSAPAAFDAAIAAGADIDETTS